LTYKPDLDGVEIKVTVWTVDIQTYRHMHLTKCLTWTTKVVGKHNSMYEAELLTTVNMDNAPYVTVNAQQLHFALC